MLEGDLENVNPIYNREGRQHVYMNAMHGVMCRRRVWLPSTFLKQEDTIGKITAAFPFAKDAVRDVFSNVRKILAITVESLEIRKLW